MRSFETESVSRLREEFDTRAADGVNVVAADVEATNCVIHVIDAVILP